MSLKRIIAIVLLSPLIPFAMLMVLPYLLLFVLVCSIKWVTSVALGQEYEWGEE
jgi:hypothetical protein